MKKLLPVILALLVSCQDSGVKYLESTSGWHTIDFGEFSIETPNSIKYEKEKGIDSFVGRLKGDSIEYIFDYGAYSPSLIPSPTEYAKSNESKSWIVDEIYEQKIKLNKNIPYPVYEDVRILEIKVDTLNKWRYKTKVTYKDSIFYSNIEYPEKFRIYHIETDTLNNKYIKIIYPNDGQKGIVGIYVENLNIVGGFGHYPKLMISTVNAVDKVNDSMIRMMKSVKLK